MNLNRVGNRSLLSLLVTDGNKEADLVIAALRIQQLLEN
ncbi:hypothetical protein NIES2104_55020 [Leptolyngbya sp. NIES-2104]|nr:hypothetical protein NIES2104_55020 [Leptolyngbya sp. NIES-2104]